MGNQRIYNGLFSVKDHELFDALTKILVEASQPFALELPLVVLDDEDYPDKEKDGFFNILGQFDINECKVILFENRISRAAKELGCTQEELNAIVFAHEMGHYIYFSHPLIYGEKKQLFPVSCYDKNKYEELYEIYAQLFALWSANGIGWAEIVYDALSQRQSGVYRSYNGYLVKSRTEMINKIPVLRDDNNQQNWLAIL